MMINMQAKQRYYDTHRNNQNDHDDGHDDAEQAVTFHKKIKFHKLRFKNITAFFRETIKMIKLMSNK